MKDVKRKTIEEEVSTAILGRQVFESIGSDNKRLLKAPSRRSYVEMDVAKARKEDGNNKEKRGEIETLFEISMFQNGGYFYQDEIKDEAELADFGDNSEDIVWHKWKENVEKEKIAGSSSSGVNKLTSFLQGNRTVFRIRLGTGGPAKIPSMKLKLNPKDQAS